MPLSTLSLRHPTRRQACQTLAAGILSGDAFLAAASGAPAGAAAPWLSLPATPTLPTPMRSDLATVNGTSIFFAEFGDGSAPSVLLLHGGLGNSNYWGLLIAQLIAQHFLSSSWTHVDTGEARSHPHPSATAHLHRM
jgi:hypothetical protein